MSSILVAMPRRRIFVSNVCLGRRLRVMPLGCLKDSLVQHSQVHLSPLHDSAIGGKRRFSGGGRSGTLAAADSDKAPQLLHYEWLHPKASVAPVLPVTTLTSSPSSHHHQHIVTVVLHGLLGNVRNIKTLATRLCELPLQSQSQPSGAAIVATTTRASLVMDLTGHGRSSKNMSDSSNNNNNNSTADARSSSGSSTAVTSVADVARDVAWTLRQALRDPKGHPMFATPGGSPTIPLTASSTSGSSSSTLRINCW